MSNNTRKRIWPVSLVAALGLVVVLAAFVAFGMQPGVSQAQGDPPPNPFATPEPTTPPNGGNGNGGTTPPAAPESTIVSSSTSGGSNVRITLTITAAELAAAAGGAANLSAGDRIEIYMEDDYSVPDSISAGDVYVRHIGASGIELNGGGRVSAANVSIDTDEHFTVTKSDYAISVLLPDMDPRDDFFNYPSTGDDLTVVIQKSAGINNPTEHGTHSVGYSILTGNEADNGGPEVTLPVLSTVAKISISDADNTRGYEMTVAGSGFNNGTTAEVFVLSDPNGDADGDGKYDGTCEDLVNNLASSNVGSGLVGGNDKVDVIFDVTVPT